MAVLGALARSWAFAPVLGCLLGAGIACDVDVGSILGDEPSAFDYEGRRVGIILDGESTLCAGTIERLSQEVERAEVALGIGPYEDVVELQLLESDVTLVERCGHSGGCYRGHPRDRVVFERRDEVEHEPNYWIPFDRIDVEFFGDVPEMLRHGFANALTDRSCTVPDKNLDELLSRTASEGLTLSEGQASGQLVRSLLRDEPAGAVAEWMAVLDAASPASYVRATYEEFFAEDLDERWDTVLAQAAIEPPGGWCTSPELAPDSFDPATWSLDLAFDCADSRIEGDLRLQGRYAVVRSLYVPASGTVAVVGSLPEGTLVQTRSCRCDAPWLPRGIDEPWWASEGWMELRVLSDGADGRRVSIALAPAD